MKKLGRYDVIGVIGSGAMGWVYECRDPNLDRRVAIKTIKVENLSANARSEYETRFKVEAHSAARLQHPHIVSVYDSDRDAGVSFLVMEFIEGNDLKHHLDSGKLFSLRETLNIMVALLSALDYAHRRQIVHRDVKPANLLIDLKGCVKLTDFGVARIQNSGEVTRTQGSVVGTLKYMSPEQIQSLPVDARTDIFAAGVVLYQLLTGLRPFEADTDFGVIQKIVSYSPAAATLLNPQLPLAIDSVVDRALAKSRDQRFTTASEFSDALLDACRETDAWLAKPILVPSKPLNPPSQTLAVTQEYSPISDGASTITQEIELVYWKEIRDSTEPEDLKVFLTQFPKGIYSALAQRRIRQLISVSPEYSQFQSTQDTNVAHDAVAGATGTTRQNSSTSSGLFSSQVASTEIRATQLNVVKDTSKPSVGLTSEQHTRMKQSAILWSAGLVVACVGVVSVWFFLPKSSPGDNRSPAANISTPTSAVVLDKAKSAVILMENTALLETDLDLKTQTPTPAKPKASAVEKATTSKTKIFPQDEPASSPPANAAKQGNSIGQTAQAPSKSRAVNPRQFCEDRMLLGFQMCMSEQCEKAAFFSHADCIERRSMDQRRREQEQFR